MAAHSESLLGRPLRQLALGLKSGEVSPVELLDQLLARLYATEPVVKAYTYIRVDEAQAEAELAAAELASGKWKGPLHGIPISIKDLIDTSDMPTTYGSPIYQDHFPDNDAFVVERLRRCGAILVGKTNTHEFAMGGTTPPTRNPFDLERIPGGSSGGSAAAVAAGSAFVALGTDTGGSIRIPASYCGVVGLKPTFGLIGRSGVFPESWSLDHVGPIARCAEDAAVLLTGIAGFDARDPASRNSKVPDFLAEIDYGLEGIKIGVPRNHFFEGLDDEIAASTRTAIGHIESCGADIHELIFPAIDEILATHSCIDLAEIAANHRRIFSAHAAEYLPETKPLVEAGFLVGAATYIDALRARPRLLDGVLKAMEGVDVIVTPTQPIVAPQVGVHAACINGAQSDLLPLWARFTAAFNLTGQPALSTCCGLSSQGLPIGLQFIGRPFADGMVLRVAQAFQCTTSWLDPVTRHQVPALA